MYESAPYRAMMSSRAAMAPLPERGTKSTSSEISGGIPTALMGRESHPETMPESPLARNSPMHTKTAAR